MLEVNFKSNSTLQNQLVRWGLHLTYILWIGFISSRCETSNKYRSAQSSSPWSNIAQHSNHRCPAHHLCRASVARSHSQLSTKSARQILEILTLDPNNPSLMFPSISFLASSAMQSTFVTLALSSKKNSKKNFFSINYFRAL